MTIFTPNKSYVPKVLSSDYIRTGSVFALDDTTPEETPADTSKPEAK